MKFSEPKSFRDAISPATRVSWIFGVGIIEYPIGHQRPLLSFCWSIAHLGLYLFCIICAGVPEIPVLQESAIAGHNYHLSTFCCFNFIITSMIFAWKREKIISWNRLINVVNKNLNKFGIVEDYGIVFKHQITQLLVCLAQVIITSGISHLFTNYSRFLELRNITFWMSVHYQLMIIYVAGCAYCGLVRYIGNRFQRLNAYLLQSNSNLSDVNPFLEELNHRKSRNFGFAKIANRQWTVQVLRDARSIHHDLCLAAKEINQAFGIQIILFIGISFCSITSLLFSIYQLCTIPASLLISNSLPFKSMISGCCWLFAYLIAVYYMVYCCAMVSSEARQTGELIHERIKPDISNDLQAEIDAFSLQLMQNPLQFTAHGFFTLDYRLIREMAGSVSTYLVIMIQLRTVYDLKPDSTSTTSLAVNSTS